MMHLGIYKIEALSSNCIKVLLVVNPEVSNGVVVATQIGFFTGTDDFEYFPSNRRKKVIITGCPMIMTEMVVK